MYLDEEDSITQYSLKLWSVENHGKPRVSTRKIRAPVQAYSQVLLVLLAPAIPGHSLTEHRVHVFILGNLFLVCPR